MFTSMLSGGPSKLRDSPAAPAMRHTPLTEDRIHQMIARDPEAPEATAPRIAQAQPFALAFPALAEGMRRALNRPG